MKSSVYKFRFCKLVPIAKIEDALNHATLAARSLHGHSALLLDASFCLDLGARTFVINAETKAGCDIARMFTGFLTRAIGDDCFSVRLTKGKVPYLPHMGANGCFK
ncbi:MAG: hypothetical protein ACYC4F_01485 [Armatimonadota bacterium]